MARGPTAEGRRVEREQQDFANLAPRLTANAALTQDEHAVLLDAFLKGRPKAGRAAVRPRMSRAARRGDVGLACILREGMRVPTKVAVEDVARANGVSVSTVYAARQSLSKEFK